MTSPSSPASRESDPVPDAMREAVAQRDALEKHLADVVDRYATDCSLVHRTLSDEDVWLLEGLAFGPIAQELAALRARAEEAKARAEAAEKALISLTPNGSEYYSRDGSGYRVDVAACMAFITRARADKHKSLAAAMMRSNDFRELALAAEAERDTLRAAQRRQDEGATE